MNIIQKNPNPSGAYPPIQGDVLRVYEGYALWPDDLDAAEFYAYNGFVTLTVELVGEVETVTFYEPNTEAWEAWKASLPQPGTEPEKEPTADEILDAMLGVK